RMRKKSRIVTGSSMVAAGAVALSLAGAATASGASAATTGTAKAPVATAARAAGAVDKNLYPFGMPEGGTAVTVPAPPGEPTLSPTITTTTTTRIYAADPFQEAVWVTQPAWPAMFLPTDPP